MADKPADVSAGDAATDTQYNALSDYAEEWGLMMALLGDKE